MQHLCLSCCCQTSNTHASADIFFYFPSLLFIPFSEFILSGSLHPILESKDERLRLIPKYSTAHSHTSHTSHTSHNNSNTKRSRKGRKKTKETSSSSSAAAAATASTIAIGFAPSPTRDATNHQSDFRKNASTQMHKSRIIQRWWRTYMRRVLLLRRARIEKVKKKMASINIQRVWRGGVSRFVTKNLIDYKRVIVRRLEIAYVTRKKWMAKRKALAFFTNRLAAAVFHQWLESCQASKHARGEQSEHDRIVRASKALFGRLLDRYYRKWQSFTWTAKRRHGKVLQALKFASANSEKKWLMVWHENVFHHVKRRRSLLSELLMICVPSSHENSSLALEQQEKATKMWRVQLMSTWYRLWIKRALEQRQMLRRRARKVYATYIASVLRGWLEQAHISREEKRKFRVVMQRMMNGKLVRLIGAWRQVGADLRDTRRALACFTMGLQRGIIAKWKNMIVEIKYQRYLEKRGDIHYQKRRKRIASLYWHEWLLEKRRNKRMLLKALRLLRNRLAVQTIDIWRSFIEYKHQMIKKALGVARHGRMVGFFFFSFLYCYCYFYTNFFY